ncbi:DNA-directed RNA polymerase IV subunit 1 isoform X2 [Cryptomeria japonica]|uniref:DNA-directed RNA polymerase IV subunit 1 isoform X2 n=1 Tax=Cryptomeria japonica TaxID=3369 RepID=UPI0027DA86CD|nr:DNA-directed RNA polymerase IV subunit 1 isoform X2 [Cryptomeria japonica]
MDFNDSRDDIVPLANLTGIQFGLLTTNEIKTLSVIPSINKTKELVDSRLGFPNPSQERKCSTCGGTDINLCEGHFGCITLPRLIYNPNLIVDTVDILNKICPSCSNVKEKKKKTNVSTYFSFMKEGCEKGDKRSTHLEKDGNYKAKYRSKKSKFDVGVSSQNANMDGISSDKVYMVSSDDEDHPKISERGKVQNCNGGNRPKRNLPPRKSKNPKMDYSEASLSKLSLWKQELIQEDTNKLPVHAMRSTGKTSNKVHNGRLSLEEEKYSDGHFSTVVRKWPVNISTSKQKTNDWGSINKSETDGGRKCKYCQTDVENTAILYPPIKFRIASKHIYGKTLPSVIMEVDFSSRSKIDKDWRNQIASDYWGFIPQWQHNYNGEIQMPLLPFQARDIMRKIKDKRITDSLEARFLECIAVTPNVYRIEERYHRLSNALALKFDNKTRALQRLVTNIDCVKRASIESTTLSHAENIACTFGGLVLDCFESSKLADEKSPASKFTINVNYGATSNKTKASSGLRWVKETLLGKRSNLSFRMITIGDPNLAVDEIAIPSDIAEMLTIEERVNFMNWGKLKEYVDDILAKCYLPWMKRNGNRLRIFHSNQLEIGDIFYRELKDGDLILVNRPPSVHRHSIIAFRVKLKQFKSVVALNPVACAPFGADFDGDCLDCFVPQSEKFIAEAGELMALSQQVINSQGGQALVAVTHDSLLAGHLIISNDIFFDRFQMQQFQLFCNSSLPKPAIVKAPVLRGPLWTGKQLFSMVFSNVNYRNFRKEVLICNGELLLCSGGSDWLRNSRDSIFCAIARDYSPSKALDYLYCVQSVLNEWISGSGFSVSLSDIHLASSASRRIKMIDEVSLGILEAKHSSFCAETLYDPCARQMLVPEQHERLSAYWKNVKMIENESATLSKEAAQEFKSVYADIIKVVAEHIEKDNAMLAMIKAGSKGSLQKLVQQGACLGMQMLREEECFPFEIPQKICSSQWVCNSSAVKNNGDASINRNGSGSIEKWYSCGLVENSFLDGLNPIEYFLHAVSCRGNSFEQAADIPGQIFRKLMFFLRDIYISYDGTVRNLYGNQIMQFSYGDPEQSNSKESDLFHGKFRKAPGEPVGALAASSLGEVAYSILDKQFRKGEDHPLHILKQCFFCRSHQQNARASQRVTLRLSKKLERIHCGREYGALKVMGHLQKVKLHELTTRVAIMYEQRSKLDTKYQVPMLSPWVPHFLLSKETLKEKKLSVESLISVLNQEYRSLRKKWSGFSLPRVDITCWKHCHFHVADKEDKDTLCLVCLTEVSSAAFYQDGVAYSEAVADTLDVVRDFLVPRLLNVVVKGNSKIDYVKITWEENKLGDEVGKNTQNGELVVTVDLSRDCKTGEQWNLLLNACEAIMDLIDWQRSVPESIYEVWHSIGIDAARSCCLQRLGHVARAMDKAIHKEHLCLTVDCLSVTGVFHGLTPTALSKQLNQTSTSAPFVEGFFTKPRKNFLEAAKKSSLDNLSGTLDSLTWGKVPSIGTGMCFDILLNEKHVSGGRKFLSEYLFLGCYFYSQ